MIVARSAYTVGKASTRMFRSEKERKEKESRWGEKKTDVFKQNTFEDM